MVNKRDPKLKGFTVVHVPGWKIVNSEKMI